jgi:hypothetical protein
MLATDKPPSQKKDFPSPKEIDWYRPDIREYISGCNNSAFFIDAALVLWRAPDRNNGRSAWLLSEMALKIDHRLLKLEDVKQFEGVVTAWLNTKPEDKRRIRYCVTEASAEPDDGGGNLKIKVRPVEYHLTKPISDLLVRSYVSSENVFAGTSPEAAFRREHFGKLLNPRFPPIPNQLVAHYAIITSDKKFLLFHRRDTLKYDPNCWSASFEETFNGDDERYLGRAKDKLDEYAPDRTIEDGLRRALKEELKLTPAQIARSEIRGLGFGIYFENLSDALFAFAEIPCSVRDIIENPALRSNPEHDNIAFCPVDDVTNLLPVLLDKHAEPTDLIFPEGKPPLGKWKWHPSSRMRIYLSLIFKFGEDVVLQALKDHSQ